MSSKPYILKIEGVEKETTGAINVNWDVKTMAVWDAVLRDPEHLSGFNLVSIERGGTEILGGRIENPRAQFSGVGRDMPISGYDHTVRLRDYKTPVQGIGISDTETTLTHIISETPFIISPPDGTFEYISELRDWDTNLDFLQCIFSDTTIELDITNPDDVDWEKFEEIATGTYTLPKMGCHASFFYNGVTPRFYVFIRDNANNLRYLHSVDLITWTNVNTGYPCVSAKWAANYDGTNVILAWGDGANTDVATGVITDGTGDIVWTLRANAIVGDEITFGICFDDQGDAWVVGDETRGWESLDNGATWNNRFTRPLNMSLVGIAPFGVDGDMYGFMYDQTAAPFDLMEYYYDRNIGSFVVVGNIDINEDVPYFDCVVDATYRVHMVYHDTDDATTKYAYGTTGAWTTMDLYVGVVNFATACIMSDGSFCAYILHTSAAGQHVWKMKNGVETVEENFLTLGTPTYLDCVQGFNINTLATGHWFVGIDVGDDVWFGLPQPLGVRLIAGDNAGYLMSEAVTGHGGFTNWGLCTAEGTDMSATEWDILDNANVIVGTPDQQPNFDIAAIGVNHITNPTIKVRIDFDGIPLTPIVGEFSITDRMDAVTLDTDGENCYTAVERLATLAGAEFWVEKDNGTYTVYFSTRRGEDKSGWLILKTTTTSDEPDTKANIKVISKTYDWSSFANCILFIGGTDSGGNRVEVEVRDTDSISTMGQEYWITIRDAEVTTRAMGRTRAALELEDRNAVVERIAANFIDKHSANDVGIGDSVSLISEWLDGDLKIEGSHRVVVLNRSWGPAGEQVGAEFTNRMQKAQYYNYLRETDDHARWITA